MVALVWCSFLPAVVAQSGNIKLEAQLVWGTNDGTSPNPKHKPVDADIRKKLKELPLKWTNYFVETRKSLEVTEGTAKRISLSDRCDLEVKNLGASKVEVTHFGKGEKVVKQTQDLPKGELLVLGGNAPNSTAWLVIVKHVE
jgi:hypothetical protein